MSALGGLGLGGTDMVSVDLGEETVKIAHAKVGLSGRLTVSQLGYLAVSGLTDEAVSHVVATSLMEMGLKSRSAIGVVPTQLAVTRNIEVPSVDPEEVRNIVVLQASRHTPFAREDIIVDYINMGVFKDTYTRVLLIVAGQGKIKRQLEVLAAAGLRVERLLFGPEVVSRVTDRMVASESEESLRGIIHVNESATDFIVSSGPRPIFVRSFPIGTRQLGAEDGQGRAGFTEEIKKSLDVYRTEEIEKNPASFILTGAVESVREMKGELDEALRIPAQTVAYPQYLPVAEQASGTLQANENTSFLEVVGSLYARDELEVDLVPEEVKSRLEFEQKSRDVIKAGILAIILLLLVPAFLVARVAFKSMYLEKRHSRYDPILQESEQLQGDFAKITKIKEFLSRDRHSLDVLRELYAKLPEDARCSEMRYDSKGTFVAKVAAKTMPSVHLLSRGMRESKLFEKVEPPRPKEDENGMLLFEIRCDLVRKAEGAEAEE